jgi:large subunit ribosomal protein L17
MRHRVGGYQLSRKSDHRQAMLKNLAAGLFEHGSIETTMPKAKAVQPFVEKIITIAKRGTFTARRQIESRINDRRIHSWVADPAVSDSKKDNPFFELPEESDIEFNRYGDVRKSPRLVQHIMANVAPMFEDRDGGYTRIIKTGRNRLGDGGDIVILQLVGEEDGPAGAGGVSSRRAKADRRTAFAAKLRKGAATEEAAPVAAEEEAVTAVATEEPPAEDAAVEAADAPAEETAPDAEAPDAPADDAAGDEEKKDA